MKNNKQDLRFQKADQKIIVAFIILVRSKGFNKLTVSDITKEAQINRSTFYAHYIDKYDLLNKLELKVLQHTYEIMGKIKFTSKNTECSLDNIFEGFKEIANYLNSEREVINILYNQGDGKFFDHLKNSVKKEMHKLREKNNLKFNNLLPSDYADELIVNSALDIILFWIQKRRTRDARRIC